MKREVQNMKYILLHGLGQNSSSWENTVKVMNQKSDILCPNLLEWISNTEPCYPYLYQALENYCESWNEPLNLCGLSLGGILALHYTIAHSEKVNSLALIGTQISMPKNILKFQNIIFKLMPNSAFQKIGIRKNDMIDLCKSMMDLDFSKDLKKISCQVLVICGEKDKTNKSASLKLKQELPHAELFMIPHAGHEVNLDSPAELGKKLNIFFQCNENEETNKITNFFQPKMEKDNSIYMR